ncbi:MAG TPA: hypothetical protein VFO13_03945, partial [Arthrobacter sp.]|nr:hypothetical protein [Arthrobacter sp.]
MSDPHDTQPGRGTPLEGATLDPRPAGDDDGKVAPDQPLEPVQPGELRGQGQPVQPAAARPKASQ